MAVTPILKPWQTAWVTTDLDRSLDIFRQHYAVPSFFTFETALDAVVFGQQGKLNLRIAMANVGEVQLEIIQPLGDGTSVEAIYADYLPRDGSFAQCFHHICVRVQGTLDDWNEYVASLPPERAVCYTADLPNDTRFCYTDDRALLGHFVEHAWFGEASQARFDALVPRY